MKFGVVGLELEKVLAFAVVVTVGDVTSPSKRDIESVACGTISWPSDGVGESEEVNVRFEDVADVDAAKCGDDLVEEEGEGDGRDAFVLGDRALVKSAASRTRGLVSGLTRGEVLDKVESGRGGLEERTFIRYTPTF